MDFAWLWPLARRWLVAVTLTTAVILLARLCTGCSVSAPDLPAGDQCLDRESVLDELHAAADADGLDRGRICCGDHTRWVGADRAAWYEAECAEFNRLSDACGADMWEC